MAKIAKMAKAKQPGYRSDEMLGMWELTLGGEKFWFVSDADHPLQALAWLLRQPEFVDSTLDELDARCDGSWGIRLKGADEVITYQSPKETPLPPPEDGPWEGTVQQALEHFTEPGGLISTAWVE